MVGIKPEVRIENNNLQIRKQGQFLPDYKHEGDCVNPDVRAEDQARRTGSH